MRCPQCGFDGEFEVGQPRFWVFDAVDFLIERNRARRTLVCPTCSTTVTRPFTMSVTWKVVLLMVIGAIIAGLYYYINS